MLNDELKKKINKINEKKSSSQLGLTHQTYDSSHEIRISS